MVIFHPTSSLAMVMLSWTSPNTVGWMKYPLSAAIPPPHISLAPSLFPLLMYPRILLNCSWSIWRVYWKKWHRLYVTVQSIDSENNTDFMCTWGPCSVLRLKGSPTTRFLARSTLRSTNSSYTSAWTYVREPAQQHWPWLKNRAKWDCSTAYSTESGKKQRNVHWRRSENRSNTTILGLSSGNIIAATKQKTYVSSCSVLIRPQSLHKDGKKCLQQQDTDF